MREGDARLFVISGASGSGKTSLVRELLLRDERLEASVSCTTREPLPGEMDGRDYHFVSERRFSQMARDGDFMEHAEIYGKRYGTRRQFVLDRMQRGKDVLLEIDWQGAEQVRAGFAGAITVFILPPSIDELRSRLRNRGRDSDSDMERRLRNAMREIGQADGYGHLLVNSALGDTVARMRAIIAAHRHGQPPPDDNEDRAHLRQMLAEAGTA